MALAIGVSIIYLIEAFIIFYFLYRLRFKNYDAERKKSLLGSMIRITSNGKFDKAVFVHVDTKSKQPYRNDRYTLYTISPNGVFTLDKMQDVPLPSTSYFDYQKGEFIQRSTINYLTATRINDKTLKYDGIGQSEIPAEFPFVFQRRVGKQTDVEFKIVPVSVCQGQSGNRLPLLRHEYYQNVDADGTAYSNNYLLSGYKLCNDDNNYTIGTCDPTTYFSSRFSYCVPYDENKEKPTFYSDADIRRFMDTHIVQF